MILPSIYTELLPCSNILNMNQEQANYYLKTNPQYKTTVEAYLDCSGSYTYIPISGFVGGILFIVFAMFTPYLKSNQNIKCFQCKVIHDKEEGTDYNGNWLCKDCLKELTYDK